MLNRKWTGVLASAGVVMMAVSAVAQPPEGGRPGQGRGQGFGQGFGGGAGRYALLASPDVRKDMELVDAQIEKIEKIQKDAGEKVRELFRGLRDAEGREDARKKIQEATADIEKQIEEVLLPHQRDRLKQIVLQAQIRTQGAVRALSSGTLAEELGVDEDQKKALTEAQEKIDKELREKLQKARAEALEKLVDTLKPEQKAKLKKLMGDAFEGSTFGGQGQGGQRGGQRGGNRGGNAPARSAT